MVTIGHPRTALLVASAVIAAGAFAGCGSGDDEAPQPASSVSSTPSAAGVDSSEPSAASPLEGAWQAGPISLEETEATIRRHGLGRWVQDYRANAPFSGDTVLTLTIENGAWDLYGDSGDGQPQPIDYDAEYEIDGDTVVFHHSDGSNTYRWAVADEVLSLEFVGSTLPGYRGIPDEVFQRALYMTAPFTKQN